jgi:hypothetical protein
MMPFKVHVLGGLNEVKKIYFKSKYYWHVFQFKQLKGTINNCQDEDKISDLKREIIYHEKLALNYIMKC